MPVEAVRVADHTPEEGIYDAPGALQPARKRFRFLRVVVHDQHPGRPRPPRSVDRLIRALRFFGLPRQPDDELASPPRTLAARLHGV